ncbi:MAG: hypothetical protein AAGH90_12430 [Pseudomonadota bacterium]
MEIRRSLFTHAAQWASRYADKVIARDDLHLSPTLISKAAARRVAQGIRVIEAYLRRMLILLALSLEPTLKPDTRERAVHFWPPRNPRDPRPDFKFRVFKNEGIESALSTRFEALRARPKRPKIDRAQVPARPLIERMKALRTLMANPDARARRLAWTLARRRPGLMLAPGHPRRSQKPPRHRGLSHLYSHGPRYPAAQLGETAAAWARAETPTQN